MNGVNLFHQFVATHSYQLESSGVPRHLWESLHKKLTTNIFDAGEHFQLMLVEYDEEDAEEEETEEGQTEVARDEFRPAFILAATRDIKATDSNAVFLIDHAWTFRLAMARQQLNEYDRLADRMCAIMGIDLEDTDRVAKIMQRLWRYCQVYTISSEQLSAEEQAPIWYIMDEVGCAVNHSDEPNVRIVPFFYANTQTTYSLLFPVRDCEEGERIERDFVEYGGTNPVERSAMLLTWQLTDLKDESFVQTEPGEEYFLAGHIPETLPSQAEQSEVSRREGPLKVFAGYEVVRDNLTDPLFQVVDNEEDADVLWLTEHFKDFAKLAQETPHKFINQFPYEYVLTIKDLLCIVCRRAAEEHHNADSLETYPRWLPTTYNMKTELVQFASYFQHRQARGLDNHWIVKPWNLARSIDTHITDNVAAILRLAATGPKIAQKYLHNPVLYYREDLAAKVKFDVRYCILVKSVEPLQAYVHRKFFLRFANKPYALDNLDDYEQHFTVMNYQEHSQLYHLKCEDFLQRWQQQYPEHDWPSVETEICHTLYELLECARKQPPPMGMAANRQSRALYAVDLMLDWSDGRMQPKILEINWTPDCKRACDYYPQFFNDIFKLLFLDQENLDSFRRLEPRSG